MKSNSEIRKDASIALKGNWGQAVLATLVLFLLAGAISGTNAANLNPQMWAISTSSLISILVAGPITIGFFNAFDCLLKNNDNNIVGNSFKLGFSNYGHIVGGYFLYMLFIFLWTCLLIVPGIIMSLAYFAVPYLLVQDPDLSPMEAIEKSKKMMKGHKADLFLMFLGFFGLSILAVCTLGIAFLWLIPYMYASCASFYENVKAEYEGTATIG